MKKLLLFSLIFFSFFAISVYSQEIDNSNPIRVDEKDLDIVLSYEKQDPASKEFYIVADIKSGIDSDRVIVDWDFPTRIKLADETDYPRSRTDIFAGKVSTVKKLVKPLSKGTFEVEAVVTAVKADVNYISSDTVQIEFNDDKEILPISEEYKKDKMIYQITQILIYFAIITGIFLVIYFIYREIKKIRA